VGNSGTITVRIDGTGLGFATSAYFGEHASPDWGLVNNSEIEATVPPARPGPVDGTRMPAPVPGFLETVPYKKTELTRGPRNCFGHGPR
jgi:hypothetical protein